MSIVSDSTSQITSVPEPDLIIYTTLGHKGKTDMTKMTLPMKKGDRGESRHHHHHRPPLPPPHSSDNDFPTPRSPSPGRRSSRSSSSRRSLLSSRSSRSYSSHRSRRSGHSRSSLRSGHSLRSLRSSRSGGSRHSLRSLRSLQSARSRRSRRSLRSLRSRSRSRSRHREWDPRGAAEEMLRKGFSEDDPDVIREKEQYIHNLEERRGDYPQMPRFSTHHKLEDIEEWHNRVYSSDAERQMVGHFKDALKLACSSLEWGNKKLGPFLKLTRWSDVVARDINRNKGYDEVLCQIYRLYFAGRARINPVIQLGMMLGMSMVNHHVKMDGNPNWNPMEGSSAAAQPTPAPVTPYNFTPDQFAQHSQQQGQSGRQRPVFPKPPPIPFPTGLNMG